MARRRTGVWRGPPSGVRLQVSGGAGHTALATSPSRSRGRDSGDFGRPHSCSLGGGRDAPSKIHRCGFSAGPRHSAVRTPENARSVVYMGIGGSCQRHSVVRMPENASTGCPRTPTRAMAGWVQEASSVDRQWPAPRRTGAALRGSSSALYSCRFPPEPVRRSRTGIREQFRALLLSLPAGQIVGDPPLIHLYEVVHIRV